VTRIKWNPEVFSKFVYPVEIKISPIGNWISYTLRRVNIKENRDVNTVVLQNIKNGERRYLEEESTSPLFSPDGAKLIYLKEDKETKTTEICLLEISSMSLRRIGKTNKILKIDWNQDSRRILLLTTRSREDEDLYFEEEAPIWFDGQGFRDSPTDLIQILDVESQTILEKTEDKRIAVAIWRKDEVVYGKMRDIVQPKYYDIVAWNGEGTRLLFQDVSLIPTYSNGEKLLLTGRPRKETHFEHDYHYLWDGENLDALTEEYGYNNASGINTDIWRSPNLLPTPKIDKKGRIYFTTNKEGRTLLERLQNGGKEKLIDRDCVITAYDVSEEGDVVYISVSDRELPEVSLLKEGENEKLTFYNEAVSNRLNIRPMNHIRYKSFDDQEIDGWYLKPDGKGKAPLVVFVHGGPKGAYGYVPYYLSQILAEEGFYVLHTNPRGSNTYSEDFALQVEKDPGGGDFKDILSGIEVLISKENVDSKRIGITGISYGGFMTNWAITHSQLFKAAVSENGISNWFTSYAFSDIGFWFDKDLIGENPLMDESYKKRSPIFSAEKVETPVLIIHSLEDYRCPLDQSVMFYHVLKDLGKEAYIAIFKKGPHGHSRLGSPQHRLKRYRLIMEFFTQKLIRKKEGFPVNEFLKKEDDGSSSQALR